jgi:hypothetical protein
MTKRVLLSDILPTPRHAPAPGPVQAAQVDALAATLACR